MCATAVIAPASPVTLHLAPERYNVDLIDLRRVVKILQPTGFTENTQYPHCEFTLENRDNGTKVLVGISDFWKSRWHSKLVVHITITTLDCPPLGQGKEEPHQHLASMSFYDIERVEFCELEPRPYIRFWLDRKPGLNGRFVGVSRGGLVCASAD